MSSQNLNIIGRLQRWMDSVTGQTFLNYAYSWGASIVILGTLFKLTHLPGADLMLFIGMGTEVVVFFLSAFDRPFDKEQGERELSDSEPQPVAEPVADEYETSQEPDEEPSAQPARQEQPGIAPIGTAGAAGGGTIIINGGFGAAQPAAETPAAAGEPTAQGVGIVGPAQAGAETVAAAAALDPATLAEATRSYVEKLQDLTEVLQRVEEQSKRLTTDSEEMTNLNRTLTGINTVYELQLKNISSQIGTIDQINEQTRRMAKQIEQLNQVYARMIRALTVNMKNAAAATGSAALDDDGQ